MAIGHSSFLYNVQILTLRNVRYLNFCNFKVITHLLWYNYKQTIGIIKLYSLHTNK